MEQIGFYFYKVVSKKEIILYSYNLSQTNTTLGFIKIYLPQILRLFEFRDRIFIDQEKSLLTNKEIEFLEPFYGFKMACKKGTIGLSAIEPKGLREFLPIGSYKYSRGKDIKVSEKNYTSYLIYKLWVVAMLNKTELLQLAEKVANSLVGYKANDKEDSRGKTTKSREVNDILESKNVKIFVENLTKLMGKFEGDKSLFKEVVTEVLKMPVDNFPLFVTLIKFEYNYQKS